MSNTASWHDVAHAYLVKMLVIAGFTEADAIPSATDILGGQSGEFYYRLSQLTPAEIQQRTDAMEHVTDLASAMQKQLDEADRNDPESTQPDNGEA